jgi:hypothetical protein
LLQVFGPLLGGFLHQTVFAVQYAESQRRDIVATGM